MSLEISAVTPAQAILTVQKPRAVEQAVQAAAEAQDRKESAPDIEEMLAKLTDISATFNRRLSFRLNEKLGQVVVKVIDNATDKVIREIPPAEVQHVHERIREVMGILFDERA
ncbi:MAG TPA: flagellar protein FlaG [Spirochaetales bacterium]|nr:flagellar protein FlaG [Spirochaetales bacterium]